MKKEEIISKTFSEALSGIKKGGGPFGAIVVKNGKIISQAHNEVVKKHDPTAHAEIQAIREACRKLKNHDLSNCEIYSSNEPCPMCLSAVYWANIKKIYYASTRKDAEKMGFKDKKLYSFFKKPTKEMILKKIPSTKTQEIETAWSQKKDKVHY